MIRSYFKNEILTIREQMFPLGINGLTVLLYIIINSRLRSNYSNYGLKYVEIILQQFILWFR